MSSVEPGLGLAPIGTARRLMIGHGIRNRMDKRIYEPPNLAQPQGELTVLLTVLLICMSVCRGCRPEESRSETTPRTDIQNPFPAGVWNGETTDGSIPFRLSLQLAQDNGTWRGWLRAYSWRREVFLKQSEMTDASRITFELKDIPTDDRPYRLECEVCSTASDELSGTLLRGDQVAKFRLHRGEPGDLSKSFWSPLPYAYAERDVSYQSGAATIAGTLAVPRIAHPIAVVLLLHGSNGGNRDASLGRRRYFATLAQFLAGSGIAVLRTDARGFGRSTGKHADATLDELASDAEAGVQFLRNQPDLEGCAIGLIGISQGGLVAELCASKLKAVAFIVLLSTPALPGAEVAEDQVATAFRNEFGFSEADIQLLEKLDRRTMDLAFTPRRPEDAEALLHLLGTLYARNDTPDAVRQSEESFRRAIARLRQPVLKRYLLHDPYETLAALKCPVLCINGSADDVVLANKSVPRAVEALNSNPDATVIKWPGLDHYLTCWWTGPAVEGWDKRASYSPEILDYIAHWVTQRTPVMNN